MNFFTSEDLDFQRNCIATYGSIENLIDQAKKGEIVAQAHLGCAYSEGFGDLLPQDNEKAIGWLSTAVENGYEFPEILGKLGGLLDWKGTVVCRRKAYEMYQRAARLGDTSSQINLAEMYRCGVEGVVSEDLKESFKWLKKAADEDLSQSEVRTDLFGGLYANTLRRMQNAIGGEKQKALKLLFLNYVAGDCPEGRPQPTKAVYYLTRAAEQGDTEAQIELGQIYLTGGCEQLIDVPRARRWFSKASEKGDLRAKELLQQCAQSKDPPRASLDLKEEVLEQSFSILNEKIIQRLEANLHPLNIRQPVAFSEEMLSRFAERSPTARIYLQAFKLVKQGFEVLYKSNFSNERGISLIAHGYLTENSILQAFPVNDDVFTQVFDLCVKTVQKNPQFYEGLLLSYALHHSGQHVSQKSDTVDFKKVVCLKNLIYFIENAETNRPTPKDPLKFDNKYSSWLHVLYFHLGSIYTILGQCHELAAEALENSLKCCPHFYDSKRALGYSLLMQYLSRLAVERKITIKISPCNQDEPSKPNCEDSAFDDRNVFKYASWTNAPDNQESSKPSREDRAFDDRKIFKYASWTTESLKDAAVAILKEYLAEAPPCCKTYPNACYYLSYIAFITENKEDAMKYYELAQDAEENRLPFFQPVNIPLKDYASLCYQLCTNLLTTRCGNKACTWNVKKKDLKLCSRCRKKSYCSKDCQVADWKTHKPHCIAGREQSAKAGTLRSFTD